MQEVKNILKDKVYETVIPRNVRLAEAPSFGKPILAYDRHSRGAQAYEKLAKEFLARCEPSPFPLPEGRGPTAVGLPPSGEGGRRPDEGQVVHGETIAQEIKS